MRYLFSLFLLLLVFSGQPVYGFFQAPAIFPQSPFNIFASNEQTKALGYLFLIHATAVGPLPLALFLSGRFQFEFLGGLQLFASQGRTDIGSNVLQSNTNGNGVGSTLTQPAGSNDEGRYQEYDILALTRQQFFIDVNENGEVDVEVDLEMALDPDENTIEFDMPLLPAIGNDVLLALEFWPGLDFFPVEPVPAGESISDHHQTVTVELTLQDDSVVTLNSVLLDRAEILPHVPFGVLGNDTLTTAVLINNPHTFPVEGELIFYDTEGGEREVTVGDATSSRHTFSLRPLSSQVVVPDNTVPLSRGWAIGHGVLPLRFSTVFTLRSNIAAADQPTGLDPGAFRGEAGISSSKASQVHALRVSQDQDGFSTAFAIVNPTSVTANLALTLNHPDGSMAANQQLQMGPKTQTARFFPAFFGLGDDDFEGTMTIGSDTTIAVMSLKTLNGVQTASLPSGTP